MKRVFDYHRFRISTKRHRFFIPCNEKSEKLKLKKWISLTEIESWISYEPLSQIRHDEIITDLLERNCTLFPFFIKDSRSIIWNENMENRYIDFCYTHRANETLSKEEITAAAKKFVDYLKEELKKIHIRILQN